MDQRLDITSVDYSYRGDPELFKCVSLTVSAGEMVGVIGPNGAGKTTLLELAHGGLKPNAGTVQVLGEDPFTMTPVDRARKVAYLWQRQAHPSISTVFDIILSGRRPFRRLSGFTEVDEDIAVNAARRLGVDKWLEKPGAHLSGGEYQRVLLARIVAQAAPVLLCDEPGASLDPKHLWETFHTIRNLSSVEGTAVLVSIHDLSLATAMCDRIVLLVRGKILFNEIGRAHV